MVVRKITNLVTNLVGCCARLLCYSSQSHSHTDAGEGKTQLNSTQLNSTLSYSLRSQSEHTSCHMHAPLPLHTPRGSCQLITLLTYLCPARGLAHTLSHSPHTHTQSP
ncbi:hypothetical protein KC19_7G175900 [Ceratodon purpureus]|uniref:Uncharacterized protein n=1 Tax=Ceratodon purpureus TaxID=3225 RepID=A0A8T0HBB5_CERPU|nr:hypothetical protein KC19_7G175900 [Ceratodon purpureus]